MSVPRTVTDGDTPAMPTQSRGHGTRPRLGRRVAARSVTTWRHRLPRRERSQVHRNGMWPVLGGVALFALGAAVAAFALRASSHAWPEKVSAHNKADDAADVRQGRGSLPTVPSKPSESG